MDGLVWTGSYWSPVQTRPRLLTGSRVLRGAGGPRAGAAAVRRLPPSSARRCARQRQRPLASPSSGSSAPRARTGGPVLPVSALYEPARRSAAGTPASTADGSSASWTFLSAPTMGSPRNRGVNSTAAAHHPTGAQESCVTVSPMPCKIALLPHDQHGTPVATPLERRHSRFVELPPGGLTVPHIATHSMAQAMPGGPRHPGRPRRPQAAPTREDCAMNIRSALKAVTSAVRAGVLVQPANRVVDRGAPGMSSEHFMNCICGHTDRDHVAGGRCRVPDCPCEHFQPGDTLSAV